ncbi:MAG: sensor histidine kinase [Lachnospiraceae bacterium]|nr:sensor histidine kinase [Lachnospiraceae bacterium]
MPGGAHKRRLKLNHRFTLVILAFTLIPIIVMSAVLFYNREQDVIEESRSYMEYKMERDAAQLSTGIDSLNMSTRFFGSDEELLSFLRNASDGIVPDARNLVDFYDTKIAELERMVNNNPLLYSVRVYSVGEVQEMMPILYSKSRMSKLSWAGGEDVTGWHFGYIDTLFSSLTTKQENKLAALVTEVSDYRRGTIGYIEAVMPMETLFPSLYEEIPGEWSFYVDTEGTLHYGDTQPAQTEEVLSAVAEEAGTIDAPKVIYRKLGGNFYTITAYPVRTFGGVLYGVQDVTEDVREVYNRRNQYVVFMAIMLVLVALMIDGIVRRMLRQLYSILQDIHRVQKGDLNVRVDASGQDEMAELGSQLNTMLDRIRSLMEENIQREVLVKNSEIRSLQNQINAHFIYNVLESIKMMAEIDEEYEISDSITALGKLLRYSMRWISGNAVLRDELEYIRNYLILINLRYDFEVILSVNLPEELLDQEIPKMSLQPIVENAVLHGIEPVAEDTTVYIKGWEQDGEFVIEVTDSGRGMTPEELEHLRAGIRGKVQPSGGGKGNGIGLKNVEDRIQLSFGKQYGLEIYSEYGKYTKVAIRLPRQKAEGGRQST